MPGIYTHHILQWPGMDGGLSHTSATTGSFSVIELETFSKALACHLGRKSLRSLKGSQINLACNGALDKMRRSWRMVKFQQHARA